MISQTLGKLLYGVYSVIGHYGWSIVAFTILVKVVLLPLNIKQSKSTKKMNELQPLLKEIQEKYKNDREKLNQKQLELYKEHNVNPLGGCLPLLIQLPILFALFGVLRDPARYVFEGTGVSFEEISRNFLWIKDLIHPDVLKVVIKNEAGEVVDTIRNGFYILPLLSGLTTFVQNKMITPKGATNAVGQNNFTTYFFPFLLGYMSLSFSAGLALYWVVGNIFTIVQQYVTNGAFLKSREGSR